MNPQNTRPSLADMLRPSMQTLKHIVMIFHHDVVDVAVDSLFGIPSELEDMRTKNIIETITIGFIFRKDTGCAAAKETTGMGLTRCSQLRGGFRWSEFHWLFWLLILAGAITSWHYENCLRRIFRDFHQAILFYSISRLCPKYMSMVLIMHDQA